MVGCWWTLARLVMPVFTLPGLCVASPRQGWTACLPVPPSSVTETIAECSVPPPDPPARQFATARFELAGDDISGATASVGHTPVFRHRESRHPWTRRRRPATSRSRGAGSVSGTAWFCA